MCDFSWWSFLLGALVMDAITCVFVYLMFRAGALVVEYNEDDSDGD